MARDWIVEERLRLIMDDDEDGFMLASGSFGPAGTSATYLGPGFTVEFDRAEFLRFLSLRVADRTEPSWEGLAEGLIGPVMVKTVTDILESHSIDGAEVPWVARDDLRGIRYRIAHVALLDAIGSERWIDSEPSQWWSAEVAAALGASPLDVLRERAEAEAEASIDVWTSIDLNLLRRQALERVIVVGEGLYPLLTEESVDVVKQVVAEARRVMPSALVLEGGGRRFSLGEFVPPEVPALAEVREAGFKGETTTMEDQRILTFTIALEEDVTSLGVFGPAFAVVHFDRGTGELVAQLDMLRAPNEGEVWLRFFDRESGRLIDMVPFTAEPESGMLLAHVSLSPGIELGSLVGDVTTKPSQAPAWSPLGRMRDALEWGKRAVDAERLGTWEVAAYTWGVCADAWQLVPDPGRHDQSVTHADEARSRLEGAGPMGRLVPSRYLFEELEDPEDEVGGSRS